MSEVKRYSPSESSYGIMRECDEGEWVDGYDYDALAAEAQALREQNTKFQHMLADITVKHFSDNIKRSTAQKSMDVYLSDGIRLLEEERDRIERNRDMWKGQCERQAEQLAALRARVAVVPDRLPRSSDIAAIHQHSIGWNACLDELARLNGMTVSEGLLRSALTHAHNRGYLAGHHDTVEAQFSHILSSELDSYRSEQVEDILQALLGEGKEHE
ncbi:hypothetical protein QK382_28675 [Pseudomonas aeruginosa]|nr:hypothetical protein [Pseudomonas aeruginosa]